MQIFLHLICELRAIAVMWKPTVPEECSWRALQFLIAQIKMKLMHETMIDRRKEHSTKRQERYPTKDGVK